MVFLSFSRKLEVIESVLLNNEHSSPIGSNFYAF